MSIAYHSQTDAQTKKLNRTLEDYLKLFTWDTLDRRDELLPMLEFAMNNAMNASTSEMQFYLNYSRHPITPTVQEFGNPLAQVDTPCEG